MVPIAPIELPYAKPCTIDAAIGEASPEWRHILQLEYKRRPWTRYYQHNGVLHTNQNCQRSAVLAPQYSGLPATSLSKRLHNCQTTTCNGSGNLPERPYKGLGTCPTCEKTVALKKDGTLRKHWSSHVLETSHRPTTTTTNRGTSSHNR